MFPALRAYVFVLGLTSCFSLKMKTGERVIRQYFDAWNCREMDSAADLFAPDATYEDTLYPERFSGKDEVKFHLNRVADALPASFVFCVDDIACGEGQSKLSNVISIY